MRRNIIALICLAACSNEANHLGNPLLLPISGIGTAVQNAAYDRRRGQVELIVKSNFPGILDEISAGGGAHINSAMDAAGIPESDRPARMMQMQGDLSLYAQNPGALVVALMVYGN